MTFPDIDLTNPDNFAQGAPHHWFKRLRQEAPVYLHPEPDGPGFWCITKYDDLRYISRDPRLFSSARGATNIHTPDPDVLARIRIIMLNMDPPQHTKFRRIVQRVFTPRVIKGLEPHIRELSKSIVDRVAEKGECEFVEEVAAELPLQVICEMLGVPEEDRRYIFDLSNRLIGFDDPDFRSSPNDGQLASAEVFAYANKLAQHYRHRSRHRCSPENRADLARETKRGRVAHAQRRGLGRAHPHRVALAEAPGVGRTAGVVSFARRGGFCARGGPWRSRTPNETPACEPPETA